MTLIIINLLNWGCSACSRRIFFIYWKPLSRHRLISLRLSQVWIFWSCKDGEI